MTIGSLHMFRQLSVFVLITAFALSSFAQQLMQKNVKGDRFTMMFGSVIAENNTYIVSGVTSNPVSPYFARSVIGKLDEQGNVIAATYVYDSVAKNYGTFFNCLNKTANGGFRLSGYTLNDTPKVLLMETDQNLVPKIHEYGTAELFAYQGYYNIEMDGNIYIAGLKTISGKSNISLIKINALDSMLWEQLYGLPVPAESATSFIKLNNGNLMIGSYRRDYETPIEIANTWLLEVDTAGAIVRQWFDLNDSTYGAYGLRKTSDGGFIYCAQTIHTQSVNGAYSIASVVKMDNNFNIQWRWTGGRPRVETGLYDIEELADGSFIACGNDPYLATVVVKGAWVVKLSSSGELLWERHYTGSENFNTENYLNDIDILPNGNLVAVGETRDPSDSEKEQMGLLLVLDSNGCIIENCTVGINDIELNAKMIVYPNPFTDKVTISLENAILKDATITVSNPLGQILHRIDNVSLSDNYKLKLNTLSDGLYFISVECDGERIVKQVVKQ